MKKKTIIALIVAAVLIVSGCLLIFISFRNVDFDFSRDVATKTYVVNEPFQNIQIDSDTCDVILVKTDGDFRAVCPDSEKLSCAVLVEDGALKISALDIRHWTDLIGVFPPEMRVTVYLPENQYDALYIQTDTGDIEIPEDFSFDTSELHTHTGDITFTGAVTNLLTAAATTGDVSVFGSSPAVMRVTTTTGDIVLDEITGNCEFALQTTTGDIQAQNVGCEVMACETTTGSITFYRVLAQGYLGLCTDTGDVLLEDCDSAQVSIDTDTGKVSGNFLSPKWFRTETDTGDVDVPISREGGECRITTNTGDIRFN